METLLPWKYGKAFTSFFLVQGAPAVCSPGNMAIQYVWTLQFVVEALMNLSPPPFVSVNKSIGVNLEVQMVRGKPSDLTLTDGICH